MICIAATLVSGPTHEGFPAGTSVKAILIVQAEDLDTAEDIAAEALGKLGWARIQTERVKTISDDSTFDNPDGVTAQAFRNAKESGFGHVIYPEPGLSKN
jgi:hypothetical protein